MNEATVDIVVILISIAGLVVIVMNNLAGRITSPDPENEDWSEV